MLANCWLSSKITALGSLLVRQSTPGFRQNSSLSNFRFIELKRIFLAAMVKARCRSASTLPRNTSVTCRFSKGVGRRHECNFASKSMHCGKVDCLGHKAKNRRFIDLVFCVDSLSNSMAEYLMRENIGARVIAWMSR